MKLSSIPIKWATPILAINLLSSVVVATAAEGPAPAPRIEFKETRHDFGRVRDNTVVQHDYVFTNRGNAPLEITHVVPSCGCTTTPDWSREVPPGGAGAIPLIFNSAGMLGLVQRTLAVHTNDPAQPVVILTLESTIWKPIEMHPAVAIIHMPPHSTARLSTTIRIVNQMEAPLAIEPPVSSLPLLHPRIVVVDPGKEYHIIVDLESPPTHEDLNGSISLATSSPEFPHLHIPVVVIAEPEITVAPSAMFLPVIPPDSPQPYIINIRNQGKAPITLDQAACDAPGSTVKIREITPGREFHLAVSYPPDLEYDPNARFAITARTSHPDHPEIRVNVAFANLPGHLPQGRGR